MKSIYVFRVFGEENSCEVVTHVRLYPKYFPYAKSIKSLYNIQYIVKIWGKV